MKFKFMDLVFEGRDAHGLSTFICLFEQQFKQNPTDAAFELYRNLTALVESPQAGHKAHFVRPNNLYFIWDRQRDGLPRPTKSRARLPKPTIGD